ncbi:MAG TPA: hypothetical protein VHA33_14520 [Candidatus Angelobacter sp.]|jgi:hypothetical protein|nr:hypothetical protein [Candidatus Angelobacter sp.]
MPTKNKGRQQADPESTLKFSDELLDSVAGAHQGYSVPYTLFTASKLSARDEQQRF